jgi:hypothetical protein
MANQGKKHIEGSGGKKIPEPKGMDAAIPDRPIQEDDVETRTTTGGPELSIVHDEETPRVREWPIDVPTHAVGEPEAGGLNHPRRR